MSLASCSQSEVTLLQQSPVFAMSLGAKELFHTNFLAFLLETEDPALDPVRRAIRHALGFPLSSGAVSQCIVWRERNHLDLVVVELRPVCIPALNGESDEDENESASGTLRWMGLE